MTNELDLTKPMQTRDGNKAKHIYTLESGRLVFAIIDPGGEYCADRYSDGRYYEGRDDVEDIINAPQETVVWVNVYPNGDDTFWSHSYDTRERADYYDKVDFEGDSHRVSRMKIVLKEGVWDE
jgi:hypothetical protein